MTTVTHTRIPRPRLHRRPTGLVPTPQGSPHRTHRARNAFAAAAGLLLAAGGTTGLWMGLSDGDSAPPAPADVPFESTLPQGIDGSDARLHNLARDAGKSQGEVDGSDRRLYQMRGGPGLP